MLTTENGFDLTTHNDLIYLLVREAGLPGGRCRAGAGRSCGAFWRPLPGACCRQAGAAAREPPGGCGRDRGDRPLLRGGDRRRPVAGRRGRPNPGKSSGARAKERSRWGGRREEKKWKEVSLEREETRVVKDSTRSRGVEEGGGNWRRRLAGCAAVSRSLPCGPIYAAKVVW